MESGLTFLTAATGPAVDVTVSVAEADPTTAPVRTDVRTVSFSVHVVDATPFASVELVAGSTAPPPFERDQVIPMPAAGTPFCVTRTCAGSLLPTTAVRLMSAVSTVTLMPLVVVGPVGVEPPSSDFEGESDPHAADPMAIMRRQ